VNQVGLTGGIALAGTGNVGPFTQDLGIITIPANDTLGIAKCTPFFVQIFCQEALHSVTITEVTG
jgi:hypothetical protein